MASGGHKSKSSSSEPRQKSTWQRTTSMSDKEDNISLSSMPNELRPNNWDFSDWRPTSHKDQPKSRKKGNPEWEREQSHAQESPPTSEKRYGTPRSFPRTKVTSNTPKSQRSALENLRQRMTFSDQEEGLSMDGERNNDRNLLKRTDNLSRQEMPHTTDHQYARQQDNRRDDRNNRNNNKQNHTVVEEKHDSSQIVGRLMQIRDYIKQAHSMQESLRKTGDPPGYKDEMDRLQKLMDHLRDQERSYTGLLQHILSGGEENGINDMSREMTPNLDPLDDTTSVDLDVQSETSERDERSASASSRPRIEDKLGSQFENDEEAAPSETSDSSSNMDDTVISRMKNPAWDYELGEEELANGGMPNPKEAAETLVALRQQQELLTKLIEQQEQMKALRGRQASLLALQQDAETKLATARQQSNEARFAAGSLEEAAMSMSNRADVLLSAESNAGGRPDPDLLDLNRQLLYMRNELKSQKDNLPSSQSKPQEQRQQPRKKNIPPPRPPSPKLASHALPRKAAPPQTTSVEGSELSREEMHARLQELLGKSDKIDQLLEEEFESPLLPPAPEQMNRDELQDKLMELQNKKKRMDDMLQELQTLRSNPALQLNNALAGPQQPRSPEAADMDPVYGAAASSENLANSVTDMLGARQKLQRLNEVKDKLSQLKSLVHFYQSTDADGAEVDEEDKSSIPAYSDRGDFEPAPTRSSQNQFNQIGTQESTNPKVNIPVLPQSQQESDENNSSSSSDTESQLSSLGPWGDDPEIQEKVKKLKTAKEKLRHLQNLVAMVQHSPEVAVELPENLADIAASMEDTESQIAQRDEGNNNSTSDGEAQPPQMGDSYYQEKMQEQLDELDELKNEKTRLLNIQAQLQTLHERFETDERMRQDDSDQMKATVPKARSTRANNQRGDGTSQQSAGPSVTFSSNEEVYDKMRKQRMLREELRDKKKQLESIMKKDRNKKQYYKNQDNQSDTVSYSTEAFGASASVDATMATWGGSTVDNLESITEDGPQDNEDEDDAYPIDGILQVEEEEEENNSDNGGYTIEEDVRQRRKARTMARGSGDTRKSKQSFPRPSRQNGTRPKEAWTRPTDFSKWTRTNRKSKQQENYRSAEEIVQEDEDDIDGQKNTVEALQQKLEQTAMLCQSLLGDQQAAGQLSRQTASGFGSHTQLMPDLQQQLQQQQLMMSLNQCYQQISLQQMEMQNMQRQLHSVVHQFSDNPEFNESGMSDLRIRSMPSLFSPVQPRPSPGFLQADPFPFNPVLSPGNNRLLRRATSGEMVNPLMRAETSEPVEHQRHSSGRMSRPVKSDGFVSKTKRKSLSPGQDSHASTKQKTTSVQTYEDDEETLPKEIPSLKFDQYLARKKRGLIEKYKAQDQSPLKESGQLPSRSSKYRTAEEDLVYRPGLSAGISGAGYQEDGRSVTSSVQSSLPVVPQASAARGKDTRETEDPGELSLFETLRETIYSEVATLISQNENRPHYLIELFRELQLLTNDYLKQRVLYDIKDVVSKYLVEENAMSAPPPPWLNPTIGNATASELTPSESLLTSDDEEVKSFLQNKVKQKVAANLVARERQKVNQLLRSGSLKNDNYDYQEVADVSSSVSTPSNSLWESPFNRDSLGETAIHLDKTLQKMREYEKKLEERDAQFKQASERRTGESREACSSSAMDQGSESSVTSDTVPYPRIDTQQLDQQIKSIMTEVIPVLKEHMDNICSPQLLAYIKRLVLSLTRQYDSGEEFARFFHRQLGSILQDSLAKYEGRKMRECGGDLLVDMSEVLFNELAFFRLMKDLDDPLIAEKMQKTQVWSDFESKDESDDESDSTETSTANASDNQDETRATQTEEEDLGKARDDALANEIEMSEDIDEDPESPMKGVQIELAPSETKPYTRIGSDEDDESADDESQSNEDPSETAVSINARRVNNVEDNEEDATKQDGASEVVPSDKEVEDGQFKYQDPSTDLDADQGASNGKIDFEDFEDGAYMNGDVLNGDIEVITMDDLPASLTVMSQEDLQQKVSQEQQNNMGFEAVFNNEDANNELAGDPEYLKEPDESTC